MPDQRDVYTHGHHESVLRSHTWRTAQNSAPYLLAHLRPGLRLLDVGCGPGNLTLDLARLVTPGPVLGIDRAEDVVALARERLEGNPAPNVAFEVGDVYALGLPDESFDVVHAHQVLQHLSEPVAALREMQRVLAPGGVLAVRDGDYGAFTWWPDDPSLQRWLDLYHQVTTRNNGTPDAGRRLPAWVGEAGFHQLTVTSSNWTFATPEECQWWCGLWADRLLHSAFGEQSVEYGLSDLDELASLADALRRWATVPHAIFMVPSVEVLARRD